MGARIDGGRGLVGLVLAGELESGRIVGLEPLWIEKLLTYSYSHHMSR